MRADIQRKPLGFQELTLPFYRCVSICVTRLTMLQEIVSHSLVFKIIKLWDSGVKTAFHAYSQDYG
jgi:hypothetical protein